MGADPCGPVRRVWEQIPLRSLWRGDDLSDGCCWWWQVKFISRACPLKGSLVLPSTMMQFLPPESTRAGDRVECGDRFPHVPAGLEGQPQLEEGVKGKKASAGPDWSCLGNKPVAHETGGDPGEHRGLLALGAEGQRCSSGKLLLVMASLSAWTPPPRSLWHPSRVKKSFFLW